MIFWGYLTDLFLFLMKVEISHGTSGHESEKGPHLQNIILWLASILGQKWLEDWVNIIFSYLIMAAILTFFISAAKSMQKIPNRRQCFVETVIGGLDRFVIGILGTSGRAYTPLIGTLFIFIIVMNLAGLIPFFGHSPTSSLNITLSLAFFVLLTVQIHGLRKLGFIGYIKHFADLPARPTIIQWCMVPLMFPMHIIGELAKLVSLSLRLFGNITGEDALIAIFVMLVPFLPLQFFMYPIVLLGSIIQALVFSSLSVIYILQMSPHEESH